MARERFPIRSVEDVEKLIESVYRLGYETGYYSHFDAVGWVGRERDRLFNLAEQIGLLEPIKDAYRRAKKKGEHDKWFRVMDQSVSEDTHGDGGNGAGKRKMRGALRRPDGARIRPRLPEPLMGAQGGLLEDLRDQSEVDWLRLSRDAFERAIRLKNDANTLMRSGGSKETVDALRAQMLEDLAVSGLSLGYHLGLDQPTPEALSELSKGSWTEEMSKVLWLVVRKVIPAVSWMTRTLPIEDAVTTSLKQVIEERISRGDLSIAPAQQGRMRVEAESNSVGRRDQKILLCEAIAQETEVYASLLSLLAESGKFDMWLKNNCRQVIIQKARHSR